MKILQIILKPFYHANNLWSNIISLLTSFLIPSDRLSIYSFTIARPSFFSQKKKQLYFPDNLIYLRPFMIINLSIRSFAVLIPNYNPTQSISFRKTFKIPSIKNNNESIREKKKDIVKKFHLFRYRGRCHLRKFFSASTDCVATVFPSNLQRKRRLVEMPPRPPPPLLLPSIFRSRTSQTRFRPGTGKIFNRLVKRRKDGRYTYCKLS